MSGKRLSTRNLKDDSGSLRSVHSAPKQSHFTVPANFGREATSAPASQQLQRASKTFEQFSKNIPLSVKRGSVLLKEFEYTNFSKIPASSQDKARTCPDQRGTAHDLAHKPSVLPTQTKHIEDTSNNADISQQFRSASSPAEVQESSTHSLTVVMHPKDCLENEQQNKDTEKGNINSHPSAEETHKPVTDGSKATDNLSLVQSDLIRGLTLKEYEIKEQLLKRHSRNRHLTDVILKDIDNSCRASSRKDIRSVRRDPALQYDDLRSRLNWGPTFKNAKISESPISMPQLKSKREIIAPSNVPLASNLDSPRLFAAKELGFLVLPRKMNPNKPRWSDAISHYQELASQQINYSSI